MPDLPVLLDKLYSLQRLGIQPGLDREQALLTELGNPEQQLPCIHIAGTNGKGSVSAMLESALRATGLRVGLYTSPHLIRFNERIRYRGAPISDQALKELLPLVMEAAHQLELSHATLAATFFEITTALAFLYFQHKRPDIIILETGMGGRWDATNVVTPLASVITNISLEHTAYLGKTIQDITKEKCGIIKPNRPVIAGSLAPEALAIVQAIAQANAAPLITADNTALVSRRRQSLDGQHITIETTGGTQLSLLLPLLGRHQLCNTAITVTVLEQVFKDALPAPAIKQGLQQVSWPARLQILERDPLFFLDAAHNPGGAATCAQTLRELLPAHTPLGLVIAMCNDKDAGGFLQAFAGLTKKCWVVPLCNARGYSPTALTSIATQHGWDATACATLSDGIKQAQAWAQSNAGAICAAGSLFMAGEILERYHPDGNIFPEFRPA